MNDRWHEGEQDLVPTMSVIKVLPAAVGRPPICPALRLAQRVLTDKPPDETASSL